MEEMNIGTMSAFPTPISYMTLGEESRELNKDLVKNVLSLKGPSQLRSGVGNHQTRGSLEKTFPSFSALKEISDRILSSGLAKDFFGISGEPNSRNFWGNLSHDGYGYHMPHAHNARDMIAAVYFPTSGFTDEEELSDNQNLDDPVLIKSASRPDAGDLVLLDPIHFAKTPVIMKDNVQRYPFFGNPICITPRAGTLVYFPCWLPHMTTPTSQETYTRLSIAFGVDFE